jgi:hypothetical protein
MNMTNEQKHEILYKGQKINLKDIELTWSDRFGEMLRGTVEDFGIDNYQEGYAEAEAGEGW